MRKRVILAFMLVFALVAASSCSLIIKDEEVDKQTPIIEVVGKTFTKAEVNEQVEAVMDYEEYMYSMYGISYDRTDASTISMAQDSAIDAMVQQAVLEKKAADLGLDALSEEEQAEVDEAVESTYTIYFDSVKSTDFADTELDGEELDAAVEAKMVEYGYPTREEIEQNETDSKVLEKVRAEAVKDVTVTEEELQEAYNTHVESAMTTYGNSPSSYGTDVQNGATIYYVPAGYRYVKHILIEFTDEDSQTISDLESQISQKQTELSTAETSLADLGEDASADDEATAQNRATLSETVEARTAEIADLESQLEDAKEAAYAAIQPTVDEVEEKLAAGEDFDALMEQYGQDPGMQTSPAKENGYPVSADSTNWVTEFRDAAMALENVGDVSEPVRSEYGIHIIKYVSDAVEGEVGLDAVRDALETEVLTQKQDEAYTAAVDAWVAEADAKIYKDRLN